MVPLWLAGQYHSHRDSGLLSDSYDLTSPEPLVQLPGHGYMNRGPFSRPNRYIAARSPEPFRFLQNRPPPFYKMPSRMARSIESSIDQLMRRFFFVVKK